MVANSRICIVSSGYPEIRVFAIAVTQNISDLRESTMEIKVVQNAIFSKIRKFDSSQINLVGFVYIFDKIK